MFTISVIVLSVAGTLWIAGASSSGLSRERALRTLRRAAALIAGQPWVGVVPRLSARLHHVDLTVKLHGIDDSEPRGRETEVVASAPGAPILLLLPRGAATGFGAALGGLDIATGDARFDARFMLKAADHGLARAWLHAPVRRALLDADEYGYELVQDQLIASRLAWESDALRLVAVLKACARLARAGAELYDAWSALAAELGALLPAGQAWPANGLVFDFLVLGTPLRVECTRRPPERDHWQTRVLAPATGRELPPELRDELEGIDAEAGLEGAGVFVRWHGIEPERDRLMRAVALISAWAGARGSAAYR